MVPDAAWPGSDQRPSGTAPAAGLFGRLGRPSASEQWGVGSFLSLGRPTCACVCGVLSHLPPVHRCTCSVRCFACALSWATWLLLTGAPAQCVVLLVRCPRPLGSCSPVCPLGALCCLCGVLGHLAAVHRCASSVRCPGPLGSCSTMSQLGVLCCVCGVLGHLAPVHGCASSVCCVACAVSWGTWLLFTSAPARYVVLLVRCPGPLGSCSSVCPLGALFCLCGVLGHFASVHRCARSVRCFACGVSWATWLLFTGVAAWFVVLRVRCPWPLGSYSLVRPLGVLCCVCGVLGQLAPPHRCARMVCCVASALSWATWLLLTGVPARCVVLRVGCPGPLGFCSPGWPRGLLCCVCGVLGHLAPVHRFARSVCGVACAVSWVTWPQLTGVPAQCVALRVGCPGPLGSCSPGWPRGLLCCVCGVLGHLAPVHWCARFERCFVGAVSWGTWLLFTGVPARCVVLFVQCPGPLGSCSPVCPPGLLCRFCGVLGHLAPDHRCARCVCFLVCAVSRATLLLYSPMCPLRALCCVCSVLGHLAFVPRCACSVCCGARAVP